MSRLLRALSYLPPLVFISDTIITLHHCSDGLLVVLPRRRPERGDLVLVTVPDNSANRIHRLIGLPGDHVLSSTSTNIVPPGFVWLDQVGNTPLALLRGTATRWLPGPALKPVPSDRVIVPARPYSHNRT